MENDRKPVIVEGRICDLDNICECATVGPLPPCSLVIFGASGDLTARKLIPALYRMFLNGILPDPVTIVGCSRTAYNDDTFRAFLQTACAGISGDPRIEMTRWQEFAAGIFYFPLQYDQLQDFQALAAFLAVKDQHRHTGGNCLFDLALPPSLYAPVVRMIGQAGMAGQSGEEGKGWRRIVIEKPFGRDLQSALVLDQALRQYFQEKQIFRIDHYLAKETVQNILSFRFANAIFEPIWNRGHVESVGIMATEKLGVEHRAGYYEQAGVIRDMFQNHMLQLLSLIAMEPPPQFEAERVRDEKIKLLRSVSPLHANAGIVLGQYGPGTIDGGPVAGYCEEPGVAAGSLIPTFAMLPVQVENWRWQGVPFYLISGKRMARKETRIVVQFKDVPHSLFRDIPGAGVVANRLVLGIYPKESITLSFQTKHPGPRMCMRTMTMNFNYEDVYPRSSPDGYEKVLLDCMQGEHMLFWRQDGIEQSWSLLTPLLNECENCQTRAQRLHPYAAGSWGPEPARDIVEKIIA